MSKNKHYYNYNKPYNKPAEVTTPVTEDEQVTPEVFEQPVVLSTEPTTVTGENTEVDPETQIEVETVVGTVVDCEKLNVRVAPNADATAVTTIAKSTVVVIDEACSTEDWFKVYTEAGVDGYCMKKFIKVSK